MSASLGYNILSNWSIQKVTSSKNAGLFLVNIDIHSRWVKLPIKLYYLTQLWVNKVYLTKL